LIKVLSFEGKDKTKGGMERREFFNKAEVFATSIGFVRVLMEELRQPSPGAKDDSIGNVFNEK
jgi:hypothetical protein